MSIRWPLWTLVVELRPGGFLELYELVRILEGNKLWGPFCFDNLKIRCVQDLPTQLEDGHRNSFSVYYVIEVQSSKAMDMRPGKAGRGEGGGPAQ